MSKNLFLICPTDGLEPVIRNRFNGHSFFYTSLGNTLDMDEMALEQISELIEANDISTITLILSEDNRIVLDALDHQRFYKISGLIESYQSLTEHKKRVQESWQTHDQHTMILSYYLNQKIKELQSGLQSLLTNQPEINGRLYSKSYRSFRDIYSDLFCMHSNQLN